MATQNASPSSSLVGRLADDLARRWRAGERPLVEEYLRRYPALAADPKAAAELIYEELCLRQECGAEGTAEEFLARFPQWRPQLEVLVQCHDFLQPAAAPEFPAAGATFGEFHLLAELGRGAHGRVFLATQAALADRPVVLKLVPRSGQEHLALARLQHTHIVPLFSVTDDAASGLRGLCMPYFGGATLSQLSERLRKQPPGRRQGRHVVEALKEAQAAAPLAIPTQGPACQFLGQVSFARAICWLGICLAEALQYAHERGLVHFDLKPANVLWTADGQPMILDLHLARAPIAAGAAGPVWLGGTPAYMAPEQRRAVAAVNDGRPIPAAVDGRADLFALGLSLAEILGDALPPTGEPAPAWLRRRNVQVSVGLADILGKCLADDPNNRYQSAAALADDLRRHLADQPLREVPNRSLAARWRKWRRRRPYQRVFVGVVLALAAAAGLAAFYAGREASRARAALAAGDDLLERGDAVAARDTWQRGLAVAEGLPFQRALQEELRGRLGLAERAAAVQDLHTIAERLRAAYGTEERAGAASQALEMHCRDLWRNRERIIQQLAARPGADQEQVHNDLLDVAILWADLRVRLAGKNDPSVRREALEVLGQAEALFGPSCVLDGERQAHATALGLPSTEKAAPPPRTAWEHFAVGRAYFRKGALKEAAAQFDRAIALEPRSFWAHFFKGKCAFREAAYEDAVLAFTACIVLAPGQAWCRYNRGLSYAALGKLDRALDDYDCALRYEPALAPAALSRGILHCQRKQHREALDDLQAALEHGAEPALVHYNRALVYLDRGDRSAALASVREALKHDPDNEEAQKLYASLEVKQ
jgi:serine/threonine protein kinase/Tfp pilus assembly protein PilF